MKALTTNSELYIPGELDIKHVYIDTDVPGRAAEYVCDLKFNDGTHLPLEANNLMELFFMIQKTINKVDAE